MQKYDFCLAWNWEYDADFVEILGSACQSRGISLLQVTPSNLTAVLEGLDKKELFFGAFLDRASESDPDFLSLVRWASEPHIYRLNPYERASHAMNKASMHLEFITAGIHTPYTIILPPFDEQPAPTTQDLSPLGSRFTIKPAHGGGGVGVILEATSLDQVLAARQEHPHDYYLLQAHIEPVLLAGRPAWFRVIYCGEKVFPCWWDINTHIYVPVSREEEDQLGLGSLNNITQSIAGVCGLDIFSAEVALTEEGLFIVVDYVNDPVDLRLKSMAVDGVPDEMVRDIAERLVGLVAARGEG